MVYIAKLENTQATIVMKSANDGPSRVKKRTFEPWKKCRRSLSLVKRRQPKLIGISSLFWGSRWRFKLISLVLDRTKVLLEWSAQTTGGLFFAVQNIPCGDVFDLKEVMGNPVEMRDWKLQGLPTDSVSINNAILVTRGKRWPLMTSKHDSMRHHNAH